MQMPSWMLVNTRRQLAEFKVTNDVHLERLIQELKEFRVEFLVLDVFRSLHDSEENDNSEMQQVLQRINRIQNECECAVALVHHIMNADCTGTATITIPSSGTPPLVVYFVVNKHGRAVREVSNGNAIIATGEKVE
jgi:hypothetical protein